jgi:hypothetical protein
MRWTLAVLLVAVLQQYLVESLQIGRLFGRFRPKVSLPTVEGVLGPSEGVLGPSPIAQTMQELLTVISNTGNGKDASLETQKNALKLVRYLETNAPAPKNLLEDPEASRELDGVWYLQYTAPSDPDTDDEVCTDCISVMMFTKRVTRKVLILWAHHSTHFCIVLFLLSYWAGGLESRE